jgi:hypothetical protein
MAAPEECLFRQCQFAAVVSARKQMPVNVERHLDGGMPHALLHEFRGQFEAAILFAIDAPTREKMAERV